MYVTCVKAVEYIDFDTKDKYYDIDIPKAYQVGSRLFHVNSMIRCFHGTYA